MDVSRHHKQCSYIISYIINLKIDFQSNEKSLPSIGDYRIIIAHQLEIISKLCYHEVSYIASIFWETNDTIYYYLPHSFLIGIFFF